MSKIDNFPYPTPILAKIWGVSFGVKNSRSVMLESAESEKVRLISREIIFQEFQPNISYMHDHDTSTLQTDGRTDGRTDKRTDRQLAMVMVISRSA